MSFDSLTHGGIIIVYADLIHHFSLSLSTLAFPIDLHLRFRLLVVSQTCSSRDLHPVRRSSFDYMELARLGGGVMTYCSVVPPFALGGHR